jgi:hypothetical protein
LVVVTASLRALFEVGAQFVELHQANGFPKPFGAPVVGMTSTVALLFAELGISTI